MQFLLPVVDPGGDGASPGGGGVRWVGANLLFGQDFSENCMKSPGSTYAFSVAIFKTFKEIQMLHFLIAWKNVTCCDSCSGKSSHPLWHKLLQERFLQVMTFGRQCF